MAGWRQAVELALTDEEIEMLAAIARSRSEPARRVDRAQMLLVYRETPSFFAVGQRIGVHHQTVERCVERALAYGALAALDDRPRPGKEPTITPEAKAWLVSLACDKAKDHGYPHELWTTRLLARHARENAPAAGYKCLANLAQGTVCKILGQEEIKPHKVRYYLERRDAEFEHKMAEELLDGAYPAATAIKLILNNHSAHISKESRTWLATRPAGRFEFTFTPVHGSWLNLIENFFFQVCTFGVASHTGSIQTGARGAHHGRYRGRQSLSCHPHMVLQTR